MSPVMNRDQHRHDPHTDVTPARGTESVREVVDPMQDVRRVEAVIEPVVRTMGYELVHLEWVGNPRTLRLYVDRAEGITLDDCSRLSPIVSQTLDASEHDEGPDGVQMRRILAAAYHLEVSSPGLDRPLSRVSQFRRFVGRKASVKTLAPVVPGKTQKTFHGHIVAVEADPTRPDDEHAGVVRLADQDDPEVVHLIPLAAIKRANLVYEPRAAPPLGGEL